LETGSKVALVELTAFYYFDAPCTAGSSNTGSVSFAIEGVTGQYYLSSATCAGNGYEYKTTIYLEPGVYKWQVSMGNKAADDRLKNFSSLQLTYKYTAVLDPNKGPVTKHAGGLRVNRIINYDENNREVGRKRYLYGYKADKNNDGVEEDYSYGKLMSTPQYTYFEAGQKLLPDGKCEVYLLLIRSSDSNIPLNGSAGGSVVGYNQVTVLEGENGENGKTVFEYENDPDLVLNYDVLAKLQPSGQGFSDAVLVPSRPPAMSTIPYERNGLLSKQSEYRKEGALFKPVKETINHWSVSSNQEAVTYAFEKRYADSNVGVSPCSAYIVFYPALQTNWTYLLWTEETAYDQQHLSGVTRKKTTYTYESTPVHYQPKSVTYTTSSSDKILTTEYTYPADYTSTTSGVIAKMKSEDKYMHSAVIETVTKEQTGLAEVVTGATFTTYQDVDGDDFNQEAKIFPVRIESLELPSPKASFTSSLATGTAADGAYRPKHFIKYNATTGSISELNKAQDINVVYVWGYNHAHPVAEIRNATYQQVKTALGIAADMEIDLGAVGLTSSQINTLRTHSLLKDAMVTTFTYDPLKGMTSQTGPDGVTLTYVYDDLGRLVEVKDHLGNLVKHYEYHYKQ
jgi:YD repeat-containing protein